MFRETTLEYRGYWEQVRYKSGAWDWRMRLQTSEITGRKGLRVTNKRVDKWT